MAAASASIVDDVFQKIGISACWYLLRMPVTAQHEDAQWAALRLTGGSRPSHGKWSTFAIWAKNTFTLGRSDYQRQYEPILYGWKQGIDHYWCGDRDQGDVWFFDKPARNDLHPTMKPVALVERAILNSSKSRDIVFDPLGGSGTTLIAAERTGRRARLIELDPKYADVIVRRWQQQTGQTARLGPLGPSFIEMASN